MTEETAKRQSKRVYVGAQNPHWKGGTRIHDKGYRLVTAKGHPRADRYGYVFEHILVMEKHIGRFIARYEHVHHINGNKLDNRIENLQLLLDGEHSVLSNAIDMSNRQCVDCGAKESYNRNWHRAENNNQWRCHSCYQKKKKQNNSGFS